jgi:glycosyltransferase involved in cell wall biosynthesis
VSPSPGAVRRLALSIARRYPHLARRAATAARHVSGLEVTPADIQRRLDAARRIFDDVDLFVAPSPSLASELSALGLDASKIQVSDYGFAPLARRAALPPSRPLRIGYVGTLVWHKGVHVLVDAVRRLPPSSYALSIFGDVNVFPDYAATLRTSAAGLPITFAGAFDRANVREVYAQMDVLVVPSLWLENSPLVIHEAFMAGVPVVGARMGGIPDLVEHEVSGLLYDARSADDLAAALRRFIDRPALVGELAGRLPAVKSIEQDAREWEAIYGALVRRQRPFPPDETPVGAVAHA